MDGPPGATAAASQQVDAYQKGRNRGQQQDEIPAASTELDAGETRRLDHNAGREATLGFVFPAQIDDDEMQRQRADRKIEAAKP